MAFPTISDADTKFGTVTGNQTTWQPTYPTNLAAGDLILAFFAMDGAPTTTWPAGWVKRDFASVPVSMAAAKKVSNGTETGAFNVTLSATEQGSWRLFRIPAASWQGTLGTTLDGSASDGAVSFSFTNAASATPDPPVLNPANWDIEDTLWLAAIAVDTSRTISVYPFASRNTADVSGGTAGATLGLATTTSAVASLNPSTFTISASDDWISATVAIRPSLSPEFSMAGWRWRNDNGGETAATWVAAENTPAHFIAGTAQRLRFVVDETNSVAPSSTETFSLQYRINGGAWTSVDDFTLSPIEMTASGFVADGAATTRQLTGGTGSYRAGSLDSVSGFVAVSGMLAGELSEIEFSFLVNHNVVGDVIDLSLLRGTTTLSGTPATFRVSSVGFFTADAVIAAGSGVTGTFTADAILRKTISSGPTADAVLQKTSSSTFIADSVLRTIVASSITSDAVLASAPATTYSFTFTANAILRAVISGSPTAEAILRKTVSATFTVDSILRTIVPSSFLANAILFKTTSATLSADSVLRSTLSSSFTANSILLRSEQVTTTTANAIIRRIESRTFTADAALLRTTASSPTADAVLFKTGVATFTVDATLTNNFVGSFSADAVIAGPTTVSVGVNANAILKDTVSQAATADAVLFRSALATITADAILAKTMVATFTGDAVILTTVPLAFTANAVLQKTTVATPTADAILRSVISVSIPADSIIRRVETTTFSADAYLLSTVQSTVTADAVLVSAPIWVSPADGATHNEFPVFVFTMPSSTKPMFFHLQIDGVNTFNGVNLQEYKSNRNQTGWEYWNGSAWIAHPATGVPISFVGNQARYTVQTALAQGTWYRRIRGIV